MTKTEKRAAPPVAEILAGWSPTQVDTVMADIWADVYRVQGRIASANRSIASLLKRNGGTMANAIGWDADQHARAVKTVAEATEALDALMAEAKVYETEYRRRPWARYWLVSNNNGHVHTSMHCSTCYPSTEFGWLVELSGQDEAACVALVGESACTVCMPSAPVRPGFGDGTSGWARKTQADRDAVAKVKADKRAAKDAKAITDVDGGPLRVEGSIIATLASAKIALVSEMWWAKHYNDTKRYLAARDKIAAAIAHKTGETTDEVIAAGVVRLAAREKREARG